MKLFDATVTETVLWAAESWTPRAEELRRLKATQSAMLRRIVGCGRQEGEQWVDWVQRATHKAREHAGSAGLKEWAPEHFRRKWKWASRVATSSCSSWVRKVTIWRDSEWQAAVSDLGSSRLTRPSSRPWMRFEDSLRRFCKAWGLGSWQTTAKEPQEWHRRAEDYVAWATDIHW